MLVLGRLYLQEIIDTTQTLLWLRVGKFSTTVQFNQYYYTIGIIGTIISIVILLVCYYVLSARLS